MARRLKNEVPFLEDCEHAESAIFKAQGATYFRSLGKSAEPFARRAVFSMVMLFLGKLSVVGLSALVELRKRWARDVAVSREPLLVLKKICYSQ